MVCLSDAGSGGVEGSTCQARNIMGAGAAVLDVDSLSDADDSGCEVSGTEVSDDSGSEVSD